MNLEKGLKRLILVLSFLAGPLVLLFYLLVTEIVVQSPGYFVLLLLILEVIGFIAVWIIYWVTRWIIKGFRDENKSSENLKSKQKEKALKSSGFLNRKQKIVLLIGLTLALLMILFPPQIFYQYTSRFKGPKPTYEELTKKHAYIKYCFVFTNTTNKIEYTRLCIQVSSVLLMTAGLIAMLNYKRYTKPKDDPTQ